MIHRVVYACLQALKSLAALLLTQSKNTALGAIEEFVCRFPTVVAQASDLRSHANQVPLLGPLPDDSRVVHDIGRRRFVVGDLGQEHHAAHSTQQIFHLQVGVEGRQVDGLIAVLELHHGPKEKLVSGVIKILLLQLRHQRMDDAIVEENRRQHRLLGGQVVGRLSARTHTQAAALG